MNSILRHLWSTPENWTALSPTKFLKTLNVSLYQSPHCFWTHQILSRLRTLVLLMFHQIRLPCSFLLSGENPFIFQHLLKDHFLSTVSPLTHLRSIAFFFPPGLLHYFFYAFSNSTFSFCFILKLSVSESPSFYWQNLFGKHPESSVLESFI